MKQEIADILRSPVDKTRLTVENNRLVSGSGHHFPSNGNLVNFLDESIHKHRATEQAASYRWDHSNRLESDGGFAGHQLEDFKRRYNFPDDTSLREYLRDVKVIAEIGAGEGRLVDWFLQYSDATIFALELSDSVYYLQEKYKNNDRVIVIKADAFHHPFADNSIDLLSCEQSIHHTDHPEEIFNSLAKCLKPGGSIILSVYAFKSEIREKFDTIIRDSISKLPEAKKFEIAQKITDIGKILSEIDVSVKVPEDMTDFGELNGQEMSLQRFFYFAVFKCFWNDDFTYEKCVEFNHDWYSYPICHKVKLEEAKQWFSNNGIQVEHFDANYSNVNIRGQKA